jgi:hypothetical protein
MATDGRTENSQKISLFQIFLKIECSRVPIHFKVAAAGAAHPLRENINNFLSSFFMLFQKISTVARFIP